MKEIKGYVCVASNDKVDVIYGPSRGDRREGWESFVTNNLSTFDTPNEAKIALKELEESWGLSFKEIHISKIGLQIAEVQSELALITYKTGFVVLQINENLSEIKLYGPRVQGKPVAGVLPCAPLTLNGLQPFPELEPAIYAAQELVRQGGNLPTQIAVFLLELTE